ncbi:MAG: M23 family metallopeptidase [Chromatiales bacterium]
MREEELPPATIRNHMQILLLSKSRDLYRVQLGRSGIAAFACAALVAAALLVHGGTRWGAEQALKEVTAKTGEAQPQWAREIVDQREQLTDLHDNMEINLNALAAKLGEMQAHVARLNALGERLTVMAQLTGGEFDFSAAPAVGGPAPVTSLQHDMQDIANVFARLSSEIDDRTEKLNALEMLLMTRKLEEQTSPTGRPLKDGWMSSGYGMRTDPKTGRREFHSGVDFTGSGNSTVLALAAGVVSWSGWRDEYGNVVEINHGNGIVTRYAHNKKNFVGVGDKVKKEQAIAIMGATGRTTGPHVHFEVLRDGSVVNPVDYIQPAEGASKNL